MKNDLMLFNELADFLLEQERDFPVAKRIPAEDLLNTLDLELKEEPLSDNELKELIKSVIAATPKSCTNRFFNQLFGGRNSKAVIGDLLAVMLNTSIHTYKVAGPHSGIEKEIIKYSCKLIGYGKGSDGTLPVGGSMSNFMGLIMARDAKGDDIVQSGIQRKMIAYSSIESHYSMAKNASFAGIGKSQVRYIPSNDKGEMIPDLLEKQILKDLSDGFFPFFVNATAGTTVMGAFDPLEEIADICEKYDLWFHIDGAYCGSVMFSDKYKHLIKGVERSDSFCYNAHKMLGTPISCSIFLVKNKDHLYHSFSNDASYLYQTDGDDYNRGKTSFQCGRRNDGFKFWTLWKSVGSKGLEQIVNHEFHLSSVARDYVRNHPDYELYSYDDSIAVCFNYKNIDAEKLCTALYESNELVVGYGIFKEQKFVRLVTVNSNNSEEEMLAFFKILENFVEKSGLAESAIPEAALKEA